MNFYIDFEATQFDNKIISIGCVNDLGDTFYSLVKPKENIKVTKFITQLTGITKEMVDNALPADEVFRRFGDFITKHNDGQPTFFFCYGETDSLFLTSTAKYIKNRDTKNFMNCLARSLIDYSIQTKEFFKASSVGVNKALNYFRKEPIVQKHDALEDAEMLRELYWYINTAKEETLKECPFEGCKLNKTESYEGAVISEKDTFNNVTEAAEFIIENLIGSNNNVCIENIKKRILKAINNNKSYFSRKWKKGE